MDTAERERLLALIQRAIDPSISDEDLGRLLEELGRRVPHPNIGELIFHNVPELSPDEILDEAMAYEPIQQPDRYQCGMSYMKTIFTDSIHWFEYSRDEDGNLWLTDYPQAEYHGGGPPRSRKLVAEERLLVEFVKMLTVLARYSREIHRNGELAKRRLWVIGQISMALISGHELAEALAGASHPSAQPPLPDRWGSEVDSAIRQFVEVANNAS